MQRLRITALAGAAALVMGVSLAAPAQADSAWFPDLVNDSPRGFDITQVRVDNGKRIAVKVTIDQLRRASRAGLGIYFDTRGPDRGPEYLAGGSLGADREWAAFRIENWQGGNPRYLARCDIKLRVSYQADRATFDIARTCFHRPGRIRVAANLTGPRGQDDWAPRSERFYDWVPR